MRVGWGVRVAGLDTTSVAPPGSVASVAAVTSSKLSKNHMFLQSKRARTLLKPPQITPWPKSSPEEALGGPGGAWGGSGGALGELWEALGEPVGGSGGALAELWEALAELWEALGELWEGLYIQKLPINRPSGRYVRFQSPERLTLAPGIQLSP